MHLQIFGQSGRRLKAIADSYPLDSDLWGVHNSACA